jgi:DNA-directed RNA polymerase specialized sigma subunit
MDNHLTHGWNKSFFQWIRKVKAAKSKKIYLLERLKLYRSKLTSCKGTNFEKSPSLSNGFNDPSFYWLTKIEEVETEINTLDLVIERYDKFYLQLSSHEKQVIQDVIIDGIKVSSIAKEMNISRNRVYEVKNTIIIKWIKFEQE